MIFYAKSLMSPKLFWGGPMTFLLATFAVINQVKAQDENATQTCSSTPGFDSNSYNFGFHVGSFFIILFTSSFGAFLPVITKRNPGFKVPKAVFFFCMHFGTGVITATAFIHMIPSAFEMLTDSCLSKVWTSYNAWAGAIAMMSASLIFFIEYLSLTITEKNDDATKDALPKHINDETADSVVSVVSRDEHDHHTHAHAHGTLALLTSETQTIGIIILEAGICFHSVIIGMTLSVTTGPEFISLLIALIFHQMFEGLGLGSRIAELKYPEGSIKPWLMSFAYGTTTPIGIAIGLGVHQTYDPNSETAKIVTGVLDSISAGILLYAALVELIAEDFIYNQRFRKKSLTHQLSAFALLILGAGLMALIGYWA